MESETSNPWVASNRAYLAAQELLQCLIDPDPAELAFEFPEWVEAIGHLEHLLIRPLADALKSDDAVRRTAAAAALLLCDQVKLGPDACTLEECVNILHGFLISGPSDRQVWCCRLMLYLRAPVVLETVLRKHSRSRDKKLSAYASAALATINAADSNLIHTLGAGLASDDAEVVLASATAFARLGVRSKESLNTLADCICRSNVEGQLSMLVAIKQIGSDAAPIGDKLLAFLDDDTQSEVVRGYCADVIGNVLTGSSKAVAALSSLLSSANGVLLRGALSGLCGLGSVTEEGMRSLLGHLDSADLDTRIGAIRTLGSVGRNSETVVTELLSRLRKANDRKEADELAWTLGMLDLAVVPAIVEAIRNWDISRAWLAASVIIAFSDSQLELFIRHVQEDPNELCLIVLLGMARRVGPRIKPAVPLFADALNNAWDDDMAFNLLTAIECAGPAGVPALSSVIRYLLAGTNYQAQAAERVLVNLGQDSVAAIKLARTQAESTRDTARLDAVLARIEGNASKDHYNLAEIDDRLLFSFMYVAGCKLVADEGGRPIGIRKVETIINSLNAHRADRKQVKESTLRSHLAELSEIFGGRDLFDGQSDGRAGRISAFACDLFPRVVEYLHSKYSPEHFLKY